MTWKLYCYDETDTVLAEATASMGNYNYVVHAANRTLDVHFERYSGESYSKAYSTPDTVELEQVNREPLFVRFDGPKDRLEQVRDNASFPDQGTLLEEVAEVNRVELIDE